MTTGAFLSLTRSGMEGDVGMRDSGVGRWPLEL